MISVPDGVTNKSAQSRRHLDLRKAQFKQEVVDVNWHSSPAGSSEGLTRSMPLYGLCCMHEVQY